MCYEEAFVSFQTFQSISTRGEKSPEMAKGRPNAVRYRYPLPIHPIQLPLLIPHNPVSWVYWAYCYVTSVNRVAKIHVDITGDRYVHILVREAEQMVYLWDNGFFGTGQLSRSEPTWMERTIVRINESMGNNSNGTALERITEKRRVQRLEFKRRRVEMEKQLLELRRQGGSVEEESELLEKERQALRDFRASQEKNSSEAEVTLYDASELILDDQGEIAPLEALELMPVEAIFLTFALPVLDVSITALANRLVDKETLCYDSLYPLVKQYVAYHHYRSHGWCVRSGIKFGCDYLLYKRGPPFQHAQFCITVLDSKESHDYTWYSSVARVVGGAKKTLILCYVERLAPQEEIVDLWKRNRFVDVFSSFKVGEVVYRRWVPGKNRD